MAKQIQPYKTSLDEGNAYWMARLSRAVYTKVSDDNEFPDEDAILADLQGEDPNFISVHGADHDTAQAALIEHHDFLCMAFRGTNELGDWLDNLNAFPRDELFGRFHTGFWQSVSDVWHPIHQRYQELRDTDKRPLFITGHSLGGAMATIAAARLVHRDQPFTAVYTFGQPRCMNRGAAMFFNAEAGRRFYRFQNNEDIVTRVPSRVMGYSHVGQCLYIDEDTTIHDEPGFWYRFLDVVEGAVETMRKTGSVGAISDHNMDRYLAAIKKWDVDF